MYLNEMQAKVKDECGTVAGRGAVAALKEVNKKSSLFWGCCIIIKHSRARIIWDERMIEKTEREHNSTSRKTIVHIAQKSICSPGRVKSFIWREDFFENGNGGKLEGLPQILRNGRGNSRQMHGCALGALGNGHVRHIVSLEASPFVPPGQDRAEPGNEAGGPSPATIRRYSGVMRGGVGVGGSGAVGRVVFSARAHPVGP